MLLYTDGLVERRGEPLDDGMERLRRRALAHRDLTADPFVDELVREARDLTDDVAVLCAEIVAPAARR